MRLIDQILSKENMLDAIESVKRNKGAAGIDKVTVGELDEYFRQNWSEMKTAILTKKYEPQPVRRVYIPKSNGKLRPLGIPAVADRVIQQAIAQELVRIVDSSFSKNSHGFRPQRSCHSAMEQALQNLNDGYEWVIDIDIEKYFDTVNHDKLISILREQVNEATTLSLIRRFLKAGVMENGVFCQSNEGYRKAVLFHRYSRIFILINWIKNSKTGGSGLFAMLMTLSYSSKVKWRRIE